MWNVPAALENHSPRRPLHEASDPLRVLRRAELVGVAVESERRAAHSAQLVVEAPLREGWVEPGIDPGVEYPPRLRAVVSLEALDLAWLLEGRTRGTKA